MGMAAMIGMCVGIFGLGLIYRTWDATREAAENSRKTLERYIYRERAILRLPSAKFSYVDGLPVSEGFVAYVLNHGASVAELQSVQWEYLDGPIWPKRLRYEKFTPDVVATDSEHYTAHLGCDDLKPVPKWLAVRLTYRTLGSETFTTHAAFKIDWMEGSQYLGAGFYAHPPHIIANQPIDT